MLAHHRQLGVNRFFVVDNGSTDGTTEFLLEQPDVHVFWTEDGYETARLGMAWLEALLDAFGRDSWCLLIDADEQLVYPESASFELGRFCESLQVRGLNCLATMCLDMYSSLPLAATTLRADQPLLEQCGYFDRSGYFNIARYTACLPRIYGGVRARLFWPEVDLGSMIAVLARAATQGFDQDAYLRAHDDVRAAVGAGVLDSALDHFLTYGWREGRAVVTRAVNGWPEGRYLSAHPGVESAVAQGVFASGLEHYIRHGQFESFLPAPWPPCLSQVPLVRWQDGLRFRLGRHHLQGATWRRPDGVG